MNPLKASDFSLGFTSLAVALLNIMTVCTDSIALATKRSFGLNAFKVRF